MAELLKLLLEIATDIQHATLSTTLSVEEELTILLASVERLTELLHPLNLDLYTQRCQAFTTALMVDNREAAIPIAIKLVEFLDLIYREIPYHPILGLQLYTLGDLYEEIGNPSEAKIVHRRARDILQVSFGSDHVFCRALEERL